MTMTMVQILDAPAHDEGEKEGSGPKMAAALSLSLSLSWSVHVYVSLVWGFFPWRMLFRLGVGSFCAKYPTGGALISLPRLDVMDDGAQE